MSKIFKLFMMLLLISACSKEDQENLTIVNTQGKQVIYSVELAQTPDELQTGLMNRESLAPDHGMIFDLAIAAEKPVAMWMKDTSVALDMLFIDEEGMIYWIYENAEPQSTQLIIPPYQPAAVMEVNAGDVQKHNIEIGNIVSYKLFKPAPQSESDEETKSEAEIEALEEEKASVDAEEIIVEEEPQEVESTLEQIKEQAEELKEETK